MFIIEPKLEQKGDDGLDTVFRIKPKRLCLGDTIGIIAPASPGNMDVAMLGMQWLEEKGFRIRLGKTVEQSLGYLAGSDADRAADINAMFASAEIDAIICLRGGYGTMRLLDLIDYDVIRNHPKIFIGYSDITALHVNIGQRTGLITFHGPMVASDIGKGLSDYTWDYFSRAIMKSEPLGVLYNPPELSAPVVIVPGTAHGDLTGGNLSLIASTLGTPYEIDTRGKILCLEEVGEAPYRIDRMLTQLLLAGKLQDAAGIVVAACTDCDDDEAPSFTLEEVVRDRLGGLCKPVLYGLYFGHTAEKSTLPLGAKAVLGGETSVLEVIEAATID